MKSDILYLKQVVFCGSVPACPQAWRDAAVLHFLQMLEV
jgi:hypothetical protein